MSPSNVMAEQVGPTFYDTNRVGAVLGGRSGPGLSPSAVRRRRARGRLLAMKTADGRWVYPTWQFTDTGDVVGGLCEVLAVLGEAPTWSVATWLSSPNVDLDDMTPAQWLTLALDRTWLLEVCQRTAALWRQ